MGSLLRSFSRDESGIYSSNYIPKSDQALEVALREKIAKVNYDNYLSAISKSHSIPVMDYEVRYFLSNLPINSQVLDLGGCWGWHWRDIKSIRPDINVLILDFVRTNLLHAKRVLGRLIGDQIELMHGDATKLPTEFHKFFDGVWTVQTFQHIPSFEQAVLEAYSALKPSGKFCCYSLNTQFPIQFISKVIGKKYHVHGTVEGFYYLSRASQEQRNIIENIFQGTAVERLSEILFSPEIFFDLPGRENSLLGRLDSILSNNLGLMSWFARQKSFHIYK